MLSKSEGAMQLLHIEFALCRNKYPVVLRICVNLFEYRPSTCTDYIMFI